MSVLTSDGTVMSRMDVVPRDDEAMELYGPTFTLQPTEGEEGELAARLLQEALEQGVKDRVISPVAIIGIPHPRAAG